MFLRPGESEKTRNSFTRRAVLLGGVQLACFAALGGRLYQLQVMEGQLYEPLANRNRLSAYTLAPLRGRILDRQGRVLAGTEEVFRCYVTPSLAGNVRDILEALSGFIRLDSEEKDRILARARRQAPNLPIIVADRLTWEQVAQANVHAPWLPGVQIEIAGRRTYDAGRALGHIVGYVGAVERFALDDRPALRVPGFKVGKTGVEHGMDAVLSGLEGTVRREVDAHGRVVRQISRVEPTRGKDVVLSISSGMQERLLARLSRYRRASCVVVDAETGAVIAMASNPSADVGRLTRPDAVKEWQRMRQRRDDPLFNRTVQGLYPPGSTFKMVTALAALEAGVINGRERINCGGFVKIARRKFRCWSRGGHGPCDMHRALRESCDVYFYEISQRVGMQRIAEMAHKLGLGEVFDNGLAGQRAGLIPDADWKRAEKGIGWYTGETLHASIGQGYVQTNPLQLAVMTARLASGRSVEPHLARELASPAPPAARRLDIDGQHLNMVRRAMLAVVNEAGGTGKRARLETPGFILAGKTGTSQVTRLSSRFSTFALKWHLRDHALFVGYVQELASGRPRFALSVIVEHGGSGGKVAAPLALDVAQDVLSMHGQLPASRDFWLASGSEAHLKRQG